MMETSMQICFCALLSDFVGDRTLHGTFLVAQARGAIHVLKL